MLEKEDNYSTKTHIPDLESILGLVWLGILGVTVVAGTAYGLYRCLPQPVQDATYDFCSNIPAYLPFIS